MRYYCKECKGTVILGEGTTHIKDVQFACCICTVGTLAPLPDYETPEQYENRTGKRIKTAYFAPCVQNARLPQPKEAQ